MTPYLVHISCESHSQSIPSYVPSPTPSPCSSPQPLLNQGHATKASSRLKAEAHVSYCLWDHVPWVSASTLETSCCLYFLSDPIPNRSQTPSPPNFFSPAHSIILASNTSRHFTETGKLAEDLHPLLLSSRLSVLSPALQQNIVFSLPPCNAHILCGSHRPSHPNLAPPPHSLALS